MNWNIELKERKIQPILSIRVRTSLEDLPKIIGASYMKIMEYMDQIGESPAGPPFTAYYNLDMNNMDVEMGFPLKNPSPGKGEILAGEIPEGIVVTCTHEGAYKSMEILYNAMFEWMEENGYASTGVYYEYYLNSPDEAPEDKMLTKIELPVKKENEKAQGNLYN